MRGCFELRRLLVISMRGEERDWRQRLTDGDEVQAALLVDHPRQDLLDECVDMLAGSLVAYVVLEISLFSPKEMGKSDSPST